jgi:hypothetical protein
MGTNGEVLLVMAAASLAALTVASSRSMKISANIVVLPWVERTTLAQFFPRYCDGHHKMSRQGANAPPLGMVISPSSFWGLLIGAFFCVRGP